MLKKVLFESDHPLARADWIWPEGELYLNNCHAEFRHDFMLKRVPEHAPLFISADQNYRLYLNGVYVCRGPARGYQSHWPFDEVDAAPYLKTGHNFIAVEAYNPGCGSFKYLHVDNAGMICAAEWGETQIHTRRHDWQMRRSPGNNPNVARLSYQMEFQEDFDASKDDLSWITSPEPPRWIEDPKYRYRGCHVFGNTWESVEERGIPLLRESLVVPAVTATASGRMKRGWRNAFNVAYHWSGGEYQTIREWLPGRLIPSSRRKDGLRFTAHPSPKGEFRAVTISVGRISSGTLGLELENCTGKEIVDCYYHQSVPNGIPTYMLPGDGVAMATRLRAAKGRCGRTFYPVMGTREITLIFRAVTQPVKVKAVWRLAEYPFTMRGKFDTSDRELNAIVDLCRTTQQACASDAYVDTPWREQGQWWGDARVQARNTFFLDGDPRLLKRGIESIAGQPNADHLTPGVAPCSKPQTLPDFSLTWILTIYDYYFQTGDVSLFLEQRPQVEANLAYFEKRMRGGIILYDPRYWLFEDWSDLLPKRDFPTFINLWHLYTLGFYEKLLRAAGEKTDALKKRITEREKLLVKTFYDPARRLFIAGRGLNGEELGAPTLHDQVLAILCGLVPEAWPVMAKERLLPFLCDEKCDFATPTSFWCTYLFEAARALGFGREIVEFIRRHWLPMLGDGGTWEHLVWDKDDGQSCSHAWSAHPASHLPETLLNLQILAPRWQHVAASPDPAVLPASGTILIPTPLGDLVFAWKKGDFELTVPAGMTLDWAWQGKRRTIRQDAPRQ